MKTISSLGEFGFIRQVTQSLKLNKNVLVGPGDDCAAVRIGSKTILLTTDLLIENVHFKTAWMTAREIGFKAMRVNLSDIAAMGGRPLYALISVGLPKSSPLSFAKGLFRGLREAAEEAGCSIVGGDTNAADRVILNVALLGEARAGRILTRGGAKVGDAIYVTGRLGAAAMALRAHRSVRPPLRLHVGEWLAQNKGVHSLIDLSDGLAGDLAHILEQSGVGAEVCVDAIPRSSRRVPLSLLLAGGEDYELLFAASPRVKMPHKIHGIPVTKIGRIIDKRKGLRFIDGRGKALKALTGFQHF